MPVMEVAEMDEILSVFESASTLYEFGLLLEEHDLTDEQLDQLEEIEIRLQQRAERNPDAEFLAELDHFERNDPQGYEQIMRDTWRKAMTVPHIRARLLAEVARLRGVRPSPPCLPRRTLSGRGQRPSHRRSSTCKARGDPGRPRPSADDPEPPDVAPASGGAR